MLENVNAPASDFGMGRAENAVCYGQVSVTVMTYNVGNGLAEPGRLARLLRYMDADLIGVQELASSQSDALRTELRGVYPHRVLLPTGFSGKGLLSRYPIVEWEELALYPGRPDLRVVVDIDAVPVCVFVVHPPPPRWGGFEPAALAQLNALVNAAVRHAPSVLLGDFNMTRRNPIYAQFVGAGLADAFAVAGTGRGWTLPRRLGHASRFNHGLQGLPLQPIARVDYIWYTASLCAEAAWVGDDGGSDHLPVLARLAQRAISA